MGLFWGPKSRFLRISLFRPNLLVILTTIGIFWNDFRGKGRFLKKHGGKLTFLEHAYKTIFLKTGPPKKWSQKGVLRKSISRPVLTKRGTPKMSRIPRRRLQKKVQFLKITKITFFPTPSGRHGLNYSIGKARGQKSEFLTRGGTHFLSFFGQKVSKSVCHPGGLFTSRGTAFGIMKPKRWHLGGSGPPILTRRSKDDGS